MTEQPAAQAPASAPTPADVAAMIGRQAQPGQGEAQPAETDWKAEARKWEARSRQNHNDLKQAKEQLNNFRSATAQALGLEQAPADPKALAAQLAEAQQAATDARRELAVHRLAAQHGADPAALADSASFLRAIRSLDPADDDAIAAAIRQAVEAHPAYKTQPAQAPSAGWRDATAATPPVTDADAEALRILGF